MEETEFADIIAKVRPLVVSFATRFFVAASMEEETEDAVQDVLVRLWKMRDSIPQVRNLEAWVTTITKNHCVSRYRKRRQATLLPLDDYDFVGSDRADDGIINREMEAKARQLLNRLPRNTKRYSI